MSMSIYHNQMAAGIQTMVSKNNKEAGKSLKQLASGLKITGAGDGASDYAISEKMRVQIRSLDQAEQNTQNSGSLLKTAAGGIQNIVDNMKSLQELALRSANDVYTDTDRATMQKEWDARVSEIDDIAVSTNFNGKSLLDGSYTNGELRAIDAFTPVQGKLQVIPANAGDITLAEDGRYYFAAGYSGTVTVTASNISLGGEMKNSSIQFMHSGMNVYASGLTIKNTAYTGKSMMAFTGGANTLKIDTGGLELYNDVDAGGKAGLNIGDELDIQVADKTDSLRVYTEGSGAGVGTDAGKSAKRLTITGTGHTDIRDVSVSCAGDGAGIGTGYHGHIDSIVVNNTSLDVASQADGAAIGCGQGASSLGALWLENCTGDMDTTYGDHDVPVGQNQAQSASVGRVYLRDNQVNYITGKLSDSWPYEPLRMQTGVTASAKTNFYLNRMTSGALGLDVVDVKTRQSAARAIKRLDSALNYALGEETRVGAYSSRLDYTAANLTLASENVTSAESTIRDTDMAKTMVAYTKDNVLAQAAQSMLAQANQNSSSVINLLKES